MAADRGGTCGARRARLCRIGRGDDITVRQHFERQCRAKLKKWTTINNETGKKHTAKIPGAIDQ